MILEDNVMAKLEVIPYVNRRIDPDFVCEIWWRKGHRYGKIKHDRFWENLYREIKGLLPKKSVWIKDSDWTYFEPATVFISMSGSHTLTIICKSNKQAEERKTEILNWVNERKTQFSCNFEKPHS